MIKQKEIIKNMKKYKIIKKRLSKTIIELLRNIQMMCFINPLHLKQFSELLKKKLVGDEEQKFYKYIYNNWIKKDYKIYNYYNIFNNNNKLLFSHIYLTNNIAESLHGKISKLIPKVKMSSYDFINVISDLITKNEIKNNEIIRKDFITKTLINIALDICEDEFIWITYDKYKEIFNSIINKEKIQNNINIMKDLLEKLDLSDENEILNKDKPDKNNNIIM